MNLNNPTIILEPEEDIDDPYIHTVSTEMFVETVEQVIQEQNREALTPSKN